MSTRLRVTLEFGTYHYGGHSAIRYLRNWRIRTPNETYESWIKKAFLAIPSEKKRLLLIREPRRVRSTRSQYIQFMQKYKAGKKLWTRRPPQPVRDYLAELANLPPITPPVTPPRTAGGIWGTYAATPRPRARRNDPTNG